MKNITELEQELKTAKIEAGTTALMYAMRMISDGGADVINYEVNDTWSSFTSRDIDFKVGGNKSTWTLMIREDKSDATS